jgi:hypothetical protein
MRPDAGRAALIGRLYARAGASRRWTRERHLFCDPVGSTALGERTDPEVLRAGGGHHAALCTILESSVVFFL